MIETVILSIAAIVFPILLAFSLVVWWQSEQLSRAQRQMEVILRLSLIHDLADRDPRSSLLAVKSLSENWPTEKIDLKTALEDRPPVAELEEELEGIELTGEL